MDGGVWEKVSPACANSIAECGGPRDTVCNACMCMLTSTPHNSLVLSFNYGTEPYLRSYCNGRVLI